VLSSILFASHAIGRWKLYIEICPALTIAKVSNFQRYKFAFVDNAMAEVKYLLLISLISIFLILFVRSDKDDDASKKWKKKDIRDYTDADVERLYEQWEVG